MSKISLEEIKEISNLIEEIIKSDSFLRSSHSGFDYKLFDTKFCFELAKRLDQQHDENSGDEQDENDCKDLNRMLINNTDIIPNQYEGGFRVWEGLYDLIHFFAVEKFFEHFSKSKISSRDSETIMICDLGCGSGLLSIYIEQQLLAKKRDHFRFYLQDFNEFVIKLFTIPNVLVNTSDYDTILPEALSTRSDNHRIESEFQFYWGEWKDYREELVKEQIKFDLIITSDVLYKEENYTKLIDIFHDCLAWPDGRILIASKSHYFGTGGGTYSFLDFLEEYYQMNSKTNKRSKTQEDTLIECDRYLKGAIVAEIEDNLYRQIIEISWKKLQSNN
ncbi:Histidine protein methyltransferase 1 -like protein [Sarcoptes scabiei]|uniref:protein-histidine N-methyltransferase n=1 Tax=Sarcoptes scabiei TaxID=52283 RepID=A0A131ZTT2_SARSC|nr:Histidine protein methyltransferase 1 -like protein [Sarcoptes scabiei]KPL94041.1 histidine protein methyltransferase 1-like protein [Sarcoptes scabiei]